MCRRAHTHPRNSQPAKALSALPDALPDAGTARCWQLLCSACRPANFVPVSRIDFFQPPPSLPPVPGEPTSAISDEMPRAPPYTNPHTNDPPIPSPLAPPKSTQGTRCRSATDARSCAGLAAYLAVERCRELGVRHSCTLALRTEHADEGHESLDELAAAIECWEALLGASHMALPYTVGA